MIDDQRAKACDRFRRGALRDVQDLEVSGLSGGCGIELCDDLLSGLKIFGLAGNHQCSGFGVHAEGHAGGESARGVQLGERIGEGCGDLCGLGIGQAENSGIAGTLVGRVEIEDQGGNVFEVVGSAGDDEAVAFGVDPDDGLLRGGNGFGLEGIFVQRTDRACQFSGLTLCQIQHPGFTRCRGCGGRLYYSQESFDLGQMIGACGDQDSAIGRVAGEHSIGRVRRILILPAFGVELAEQGKDPDDFIGLAYVDGSSLTRSQRGGVFLELF